MKDSLLLFRSGLDFGSASPEQLQKAMMKWQKWLGELKRSNRLGAGQRLLPGGKTLAGAKSETTDGPYAEGKEVVGGYQLIEASSLDDAVEIARGCPIFYFGGSVEVRETIVN